MFGSNTTDKHTIKHTAHPIDVTRGELQLFRRLNPDEAEVRDRAEHIRISNAELDGFPSDEVVVMKVKIDHLKDIESMLGTGTSIINILAIAASSTPVPHIPKDSPLFMLTSAVRDNKPDIARKLIDYFEPDYAPVSTTERVEDKKVIVSDARGVKVSSILQSFKVPEGIAVDAETLYEKGADKSAIISLVTHLASKYLTGNEEPVDASACNFATDP